MIPDLFKATLIMQLNNASQKNESILSIFFQNFIKNQSNKTDEDYMQLIKEIKEMIKGNESFAKDQLGSSFHFFKTLEVISVSLGEKNTTGLSFKELMELAKELQSIIQNTPVFKKEEQKSVRLSHIDAVGATYESLKSLLHDLFADLQPGPHNQRPVNDRISKVYDKVTKLRNLACTHLPA